MSGPGAVAIAERVVQSTRRLCQVPSHSLVHGTVVDEAGRGLAEALVAGMRPPPTYTGEGVVEIHCHGSPVVLQQVLARLLQEGARPAEPGEFTKRAFLNGKLDLAQAE